MPSRAMRAGFMPAISISSNLTLPALGLSSPDSRFTSVLLPAPLGPITAWMHPGARSSDTPSTAARPPKRLARPRAANTGSATARLHPFQQPAHAPRQQQHRQDDEHAHRQQPMLGGVGQRVLQQYQDE